MTRLRYHGLWFVIGLCLIGLAIYMSLATSGFPVAASFLNDKARHIIGYCGLMLWFAQLYTTHRSRFVIALLLASMGIGLEFAQKMGGVRMFEVADMFANAAGIMIGWAAASMYLDQILFWFEKKVLKV